MSKVYFVSVPQRWPGTVVEVNNAGNTKHARTAALDYFSRNGMIGWKDRQFLRKNMMVKRGNPGDMRSTVVLEYGKSPPQAEPMGEESQVVGTAPVRAPEPVRVMPIAAAARQIGPVRL